MDSDESHVLNFKREHSAVKRCGMRFRDSLKHHYPFIGDADGQSRKQSEAFGQRVERLGHSGVQLNFWSFEN